MRILLIEDDTDLSHIIYQNLNSLTYSVDVCSDGEEGFMLATQPIYDLIILDRMLPSMDGIMITAKLRNLQINTPIIMVTALNSIGNRVEGLDAGADDYLVKPFAIEELLARVRALSRRPNDWNSSLTHTLGNTSLDLSNLVLYTNSGKCSLSKKEALLFEIFFKQPAHTFSRSFLISRVWGPDSDIEDGNLDNYIHFLRRRLKTSESNLSVKTVRGLGYMLEVAHA